MDKSEKKRSANFSRREKEILLVLVEKFFNVIENKKTNAGFNKEKAECWEKLAREFNATQVTGPRTANQLRASYEKMKQIAKKHKAEDKVEILKTGGGTFTPTLTDIDEKVLAILKKNFFCIENNYDCNSQHIIPTKKQGQNMHIETSEDFQEVFLICGEDISATQLNEETLETESNVELYLDEQYLQNKTDTLKKKSNYTSRK